ncbi:hypothetical protein KC614_03550 [candidate division WWE3 bacterium]|uniref:Putative zinc ribbon domain-containing protein n=1 Tax=candidate division WWE3 bacterium TaxID=2053526 RepID=A0A955LKY8_UNCKA|nr:hypothetical protein [candidate division WWE3 bacterium]
MSDNCESCGMPLDEFVVSHMDNRYCMHCQDQETGDMAAFDDVREQSIIAAVELLNKTREEAEELADEMLPQLPRWKSRVED